MGYSPWGRRESDMTEHTRTFEAGVPSLRDLMPDDLRWS